MRCYRSQYLLAVFPELKTKLNSSSIQPRTNQNKLANCHTEINVFILGFYVLRTYFCHVRNWIRDPTYQSGKITSLTSIPNSNSEHFLDFEGNYCCWICCCRICFCFCCWLLLAISPLLTIYSLSSKSNDGTQPLLAHCHLPSRF